ncbi:MAG: ABC transporter permease [Opitutales bacterium]
MDDGATLRTRLSLYLPPLPIVAAALMPLVVLIILASSTSPDLSERHLRILGNSITLTALTVATSIAVGVPLALVTTSLRLRYASLAFALLAAPLAVPSYIGAFAYFAGTGPGGELERLLGIAVPEARGLAGSVWVMTLYTFPFVLLPVRASLRRLDASQLDAARTLGLSPVQAFCRVVLPRIRGGVAAGGLLVALYTLSDFATPAILGLDTFTRAIYVEYNAFGLGEAAWLSLQLLGLVAIVIALESRFHTVSEPAGRSLFWQPGRALATVVWAAVASVSFAAIGLPVALFVVWIFREGVAGFDPAIIGSSLFPSLLAAVVAVLAALPLARAARAGPFGRFLVRLTSYGFGVPGIVMGTALVYVGLRLPGLYQTTAMLVLGYVLRFLPLATGTVRDGFARIDAKLPHAARSLGATPTEAFRRVTLPLLFPALLSGAALVFLEAMRELPLTLLLRPTGTETLATRLWQVYEAGYFGDAAVPGLLLMGVSLLAMVAYIRGESILGVAATPDA